MSALSGNVCAPEIGTDQTVNSWSPDVACLIISKVHVHPTSAHHRQILVLSGLPPEQLHFQGKVSLGGDLMTPGEGVTHQRNKWGKPDPHQGLWMLEIFKQSKQNERSPNPESQQSVDFKESGTRQAGQLRHYKGMHRSLGGRVGEEI